MPLVGKIGSADLCSWRPVEENSSRGCANETGVVQTQQAVLESAAPTKSAKAAESAADADDESGRFIVLSLTKKTGGLGTL